MGGLGKTTLVQSLYNDNDVQKHFDLKAWAWVSDDFDVLAVTKKIVESLTSKDCHITNLDVLRVELKNNLRDKKFLLVLDDLWNEKYNDWHHLVAPFSGGKKGSKIIVTTRQQRVAQVTHTFPIYELKPLTDESCWRILARHAFGNEGFVDIIPRRTWQGRWVQVGYKQKWVHKRSSHDIVLEALNKDNDCLREQLNVCPTFSTLEIEKGMYRLENLLTV
ncbi:putative disease resistance RPP13 protein 1 [Spatholobus suberectus]|nr:putative disease resistance RPP13 protein 1 [Spatholobus suberectus]